MTGVMAAAVTAAPRPTPPRGPCRAALHHASAQPCHPLHAGRRPAPPAHLIAASRPLLHPPAAQPHRARASSTTPSPTPPPSVTAAQAAASTRPPRFYTSAPLLDTLPPSSTLALDADESKHASKVLRLKPGDAVELCDGRGRIVPGVVAGDDGGKSLLVRTTSPPSLLPLRAPRWTLAVAASGLSRGGRDDWLVEKAVELGAAGLWPLATSRAPWLVKSGDGDGVPGRWERVAKASMKQSLRAHGLEWTAPAAVGSKSVLDAVAAAPLALVCAAGGAPIAQVLADARAAGKLTDAVSQPCLLFVGPEGDFTPDEVGGLIGAGAVAVGLGSTRLRVETAAVAGLAAVMLMV